MRIPAQPLLVLHPERAFRDRIRTLAGGEYTYRELPDWMQLGEAIRTSPPSALVIVDPFTEADGPGPSRHLKALLLEFPSVPVLAAITVRPDRAEDLRTLGTWGITQIVALGHDDTAPALVQRFRNARGRPLKGLLEQVLPEDTSGRARALLDAAAEVASVAGDAEDLSKALNMSRRSLLRWCERAELPTPRSLMAWMRILLAAALLDDPGRTALSVAQGCGYSSDSGLRRVMKTFVKRSPNELRKTGAFAGASKAFLQELERLQEEPAT